MEILDKENLRMYEPTSNTSFCRSLTIPVQDPFASIAPHCPSGDFFNEKVKFIYSFSSLKISGNIPSAVYSSGIPGMGIKFETRGAYSSVVALN